jgi:proteasome lid subunit RPN8/RPN11
MSVPAENGEKQVFSKVKVKRGALNHFRKKARDVFPLELHAYLLGNVISVNTIEITDFCYPESYYIQTGNNVQWSAEEYAALKEKAAANNKVIIGDIHSHPNYEPIMSPQDYKAAILDSLSVCAICSVYGRKTRVKFWTPQSSLPCDIIYIT